MEAAVGVADAISELADRQEAIGFADAPFAVDPLGLDGVEPGALAGQVAGDDAHAPASLLDLAVVVADPVADLMADVPGGVVPDQQQGLLPGRVERAAAPIQVVDRDGADRPAVREPQPDLVRGVPVGRVRPQQQPIAGQRLGVRVILRDRLLDQPQPVVLLDPGSEAGPGQPTPPDLVLEPQGPGRVGRGQADQAVARAFFRAYSGSGLVIHCFARRQRTPRRRSACRIVSSLTGSAVIPSAQATSEASSSVQTLVGLSKVRGLWCSSARSSSAAAVSTWAWIVCGRVEPRVRQASSPSRSNSRITLRTVWSSQPSVIAIRGTHSPRALASRIWQRRSSYTFAERSPASSRSRSASVRARTKMGGLMPTRPHDSRLSRGSALAQP